MTLRFASRDVACLMMAHPGPKSFVEVTHSRSRSTEVGIIVHTKQKCRDYELGILATWQSHEEHVAVDVNEHEFASKHSCRTCGVRGFFCCARSSRRSGCSFIENDPALTRSGTEQLSAAYQFLSWEVKGVKHNISTSTVINLSLLGRRTSLLGWTSLLEWGPSLLGWRSSLQ